MELLRPRLVRFSGMSSSIGLALCVVVAGCGSSADKNAGTTSTAKQAKNVSTRVPRLPGAPGAKKRPQGTNALKSLNPIKRPAHSGPGKQIAGVTGLPTDKAVEVLGNDVGVFWQNAFNTAGYRFRPATQTLVVTTATTACGPVSSTDSPNFCPSDNSLNWTVGWIDEKAAPLGSFPIGLVVATTWGYQIETQLGFDKTLSPADQNLMATCLAGIWTASVFQRGALEKNDIEQGARLLAGLSPTERDFRALARAFDSGFNSGRGDEGRANACVR